MDRRKFLRSASSLSAFSAVSSFPIFLEGCKARIFNQDSDPSAINLDARGEDWQFDAVTISPSNKLHPVHLPVGIKRHVLIVGGGLAGLSAGMELVERGYQVTIKEAAPQLGGRLATRTEKLSTGTFQVEHGLHMWFYQYYNFLDILGEKRLNLLDKYFVDFKEVAYQFADYKPEVIKSVGAYPFNLVNILLTSKNLNLLTVPGVLKALPDLVGYDHSKIYQKYDNISLKEWAKLKEVNKDFYNIILEPAASVTLNDPDKVSAAEMLMYTNYYFLGHPRAFWRKVTNVDHATAVINPMADFIRQKGGVIKTNSPVTGFKIENGRVIGEIDQKEIYDAVILATDVPGSKAILNNTLAADMPSEKALKTLQDCVQALKTAPHYTMLRVWFDKPTDPNRPDVQRVIETPDFKPVHLLCLFHMLEKESRDWANANGGSIIEYHLYNTPEFKDLSQEEIWSKVKPQSDKVLPELATAKPLAFAMRGYDNFTSFEVGQATIRPLSDSARAVGISNLGLAGDWISTNYPSALMERAISTGRECANHILLDDNVRQVELRVAKSRGPGLFPKF